MDFSLGKRIFAKFLGCWPYADYKEGRAEPCRDRPGNCQAGLIATPQSSVHYDICSYRVNNFPVAALSFLRSRLGAAKAPMKSPRASANPPLSYVSSSICVRFGRASRARRRCLLAADERAKQTRSAVRNSDDPLQPLFCHKYKPGCPSNRVLSAGLPHVPQHAQTLAMTDPNSDSLRSNDLVRSTLQIS